MNILAMANITELRHKLQCLPGVPPSVIDEVNAWLERAETLNATTARDLIQDMDNFLGRLAQFRVFPNARQEVTKLVTEVCDSLRRDLVREENHRRLAQPPDGTPLFFHPILLPDQGPS